MIQPEDPVSPRAPQPPVPNSYWVEPGRLLAGEYPGSSSRAEALDRIQRLLRAGINTFIDLTEEGELPPYLPLLPADAQARIEHHRWPIVDHGLPRSQQYMAEILDSIEDALARQRRVYVHCHAGIGRTGTTIGCYLARSGLTPEGAMEQLQQLWQQSARSKTWPSIPETDDQRTFVREWTEPESGAGTPQLNQARRHEGALLGLAVGDAFGTLLTDGRYDRSRMAPERFPRDLILGPGADTEMTLAAVVSLLSRGGHDAADQMQRYLQALRSNPGATWSADFKRAIAAWQWSRKTNAGSYDPKNLDPHTLARCAAAALYRHDDAAAAVELAVDISRPTQQSPVVLDTCRFWTALLLDVLNGVSTIQLFAGPAIALVHARGVRRELDDLLQGRWRSLAEQNAGVLSICARALLALQGTQTFTAGLLQALEGSAPATTGALYGTLAGAYYGPTAIPQRWLQALPQHEAVQALARQLAG